MNSLNMYQDAWMSKVCRWKKEASHRIHTLWLHLYKVGEEHKQKGYLT